MVRIEILTIFLVSVIIQLFYHMLYNLRYDFYLEMSLTLLPYITFADEFLIFFFLMASLFFHGHFLFIDLIQLFLKIFSILFWLFLWYFLTSTHQLIENIIEFRPILTGIIWPILWAFVQLHSDALAAASFFLLDLLEHWVGNQRPSGKLRLFVGFVCLFVYKLFYGVHRLVWLLLKVIYVIFQHFFIRFLL